MDRPLTDEEHKLASWLLEHGRPEAKGFFGQLDSARVTPWRCKCGCASFHFSVAGHSQPSGGMKLLAHFLFGEAETLSGIFIYEQEGILSGVEVYGLPGDAPKSLPKSEELRPFEKGIES